MTAILVLLFVALATWACAAQCEVYFRGRDFRSLQSKIFIERQQYQSKIDTLTERVLQQAGQPIDLNRIARERLHRAVNQDDNKVFNKGWKPDRPATPPKENT